MVGHGITYATGASRDPSSAEKVPSSASSSSSSSTSTKTSGKCPQTHFLLCALIVAQVGLLSLFLLWTIKTYFTPYQRVIIVYPIDSRHQQSLNVSNKDDGITRRHHLHSNRSKLVPHLRNIHLEGNIIFTNESEQNSYFSSPKQNFSVVGITSSELLPLTLNWLESVKTLDLNYDVMLIVEDRHAFETLSRKKNSSRKLERTRLKANWAKNPSHSVRSSIYDVILDILRSGRDVLQTATDSVWLQDPMPPIWQKYDKCDLWIPSGEIQTQGFAFLKSSEKMISFVKALVTKMTRRSKTLRSSLTGNGNLAEALRSDFSHTFNLPICHLGKTQFPSQRRALEVVQWAVHKEEIVSLLTGAIENLGRNEEKEPLSSFSPQN